MTFPSSAIKLSILAVMFALLPWSQAARWDKKTNMTVSETIEVPGATLTPGEYVVKLVDSDSNRHIVQFLNAEETEVLTTVLAIPNQRLEPTGDTEFTFYETPVGDAPALRAWFYPGDLSGQEFAYPKDRAQQLSKANDLEVPVAPEEDQTAAVTEPPAPREPERESAATPRTTPVQPQAEAVERDEEPTTLAQATPPPDARPAPQQQQSAPVDPEPTPATTEDRLPDTASPAPLLGLIGLGSFAAAMGLRRFTRR
jgi:hypothetical protein